MKNYCLSSYILLCLVVKGRKRPDQIPAQKEQQGRKSHLWLKNCLVPDSCREKESYSLVVWLLVGPYTKENTDNVNWIQLIEKKEEQSWVCGMG